MRGLMPAMEGATGEERGSPCAVWRTCGGCPQIAVSEMGQRAAKLAVVKALLAGLGATEGYAFHPVTSPLGYRNRIRLRVDDGGQPVFFNTEKSPLCPVLSPELSHVLAGLRAVCAEQPGLLLGARHVELREPDLDRRAGLLVTCADGGRADDSVVRASLAAALEAATGSRFLVGSESQHLRTTVAPSHEVASASQRFQLTERFYHHVPLGGFMQVNPLVNRALVQSVVEGATQRGLSSAVDLFCGSGNFALPLAGAGLAVLGVETNAASIVAARLASEAQSLPGTYLAQDVRYFLANHVPFAGGAARSTDLIVVDPPRSGLKGVVEQIVALRPRSIALCSCHPKTAAVDLSCLCSSGYAVTSITLFDMFAQTDHVELLAWLDRV